MLKLLLLTITLGLLTHIAKSQLIPRQTLTTAGELLNNQGLSLNFTLGELVIENLESARIGINTGLFGKQNELDVVLPVTIKDLRLVAEDSKVTLYWTVYLENNTLFYEVQKSVDGINFVTESKIYATSNNFIYKEYDFTDNKFFKKSYYRLKIVDADGNYKFSNVLTATPAVSINRVGLYPNPAKDVINLTIISKKPDTALISIRNSTGILVIKSSFNLSKGRNINLIDIKFLHTGTYFVSIITSEGQLTRSIIK